MSERQALPNVVLITTDQQRYDTLGVTGNPLVRTPHLDRLAARGTLFRRGYIQNPVCIPSRACLMTGRYVHQHGVDHMNDVIGTTPGLPPWEVTVMERLQQVGYRTAGFGKLHMMPPKGLDEMQLTMGKGARWTVSAGSPLGPSQLGPVYAAWLEGKRPGAYEEIYAQRRQPEYRDQATAIVNTLAADEYVDYWIGQNTWEYLARDHDRPFFVWCGFCGPHPPWDPPEPYASMYDQDSIPLPPLLHARQQHVPGEAQRRSRFDGEDGERLIRKIIAYYWGMMTFIDDMVGRLMRTMTERGLWENTLLIFTTDHGEMLGDYGRTGKSNFAEQVIRAPYIVVPPGSATPPGGPEETEEAQGAPAGQRTYDGLVEHVDLVPTILDYAGIPQPGELPGRSLRPILEGRAGDFDPTPFVICEQASGEPLRPAPSPGPAGAAPGDDRGSATAAPLPAARQAQVCLRTARFKYVFSSPERRVEFYDLQEDPLETVNAADDPRYSAEIRRHAELLIDHRLQTETNAWKCGLAARTPQAVDHFGRPVRD
jgi:arylsulfatase